MTESTIAQAPVSSWIKGWRLVPSAWTQPHVIHTCRGFRTLRSTGDLAPDTEQPEWSFHGGIREMSPRGRTRILANAYRVEPSASESLVLFAVIVAPGVVLGHTTLPTPPSLFAAEIEVSESDDLQWLETPDESVALLQRSVPGGLRFCLAYTPDDHHSATRLARQHIDQDPAEWLNREYQVRAPFWEIMHAAKSAVPMISFAMESLVARLRPPEGPMHFRWSATRFEANAPYCLNDVYPLIKAWSRMDLSVAEELVKSALSTQKSDGTLLAFNYPDGRGGKEIRAWPLFARCALDVARVGAQPDFLPYVIPRLQRYFERAITRFTDGGLHRWRSPDEALITDTYDRKLATVDLTSMLLCEIEAFRELSRLHVMPPGFLQSLSDREETLQRNLLELMWDENTHVFRDRYVGGAHITRMTLSGFMPLLWDGLDPTREQYLMRRLEDPNTFWKPEGVPLWETWAQDPEPAPIAAPHQVFILDALRRTGVSSSFDQLRNRLRKTLITHYRRDHTLPSNLLLPTEDEPPEDDSNTLIEPPDAAAAALVIETEAEHGPFIAPKTGSPFMRWMERNRLMIIVTPLVVMTTVVLGIMIGFMYKKAPPQADAYALSGLAQIHYREGRYEEAIRLFEELSEQLDHPASVDVMLGNTYLRMEDLATAERYYRSALEKGLESPRLVMNFGLALYRQNKLEEARDVYEGFIRDYGIQYPDVAQRARVSLDIINRKIEAR